MKHHCFAALFITVVVSLIACGKEEHSDDDRARSKRLDVGLCQPKCPNLPRSASDSSLRIFPEAADMWAAGFIYEYEVFHTAYQFSLPVGIVAGWLKSHGNDSIYYEGIMAYLGLDTVVDDVIDVQSSLCLIFTLYKNDKDTILPGGVGPFVRLLPNGQMQAIDSSTAQGYIDNWRRHYTDAAPDFMVPVYAYSLPTSTLWEEIDAAMSNNADGKVYIVLGCHTISPHDNQYCVKNAKGFQHVPTLYGYGIVNFVLATKVGDAFERSSDFLRPCPRFCGTSLFQLNCSQ